MTQQTQTNHDRSQSGRRSHCFASCSLIAIAMLAVSASGCGAAEGAYDDSDLGDVQQRALINEETGETYRPDLDEDGNLEEPPDWVINQGEASDLGVPGSLGETTEEETTGPTLCNGEPITIYGTNGPDNIEGTSGKDVIHGLGGNDTIDGKGGDDVICGGTGLDDIKGGSGNDTIKGGKQADIIHGNSGHDVIYGGDGDDELYGNGGEDIIYGDAGNDDVDSGWDDDTVFGGAGNDRLWGDLGRDTLTGGNGDDDIWGRIGRDTLSGGDGDDTLCGGVDEDSLEGGPDDDVLCGGMNTDDLDGEEGDDILDGGDCFSDDNYVDTLNGSTHVSGDICYVGDHDDTGADQDSPIDCEFRYRPPEFASGTVCGVLSRPW